MSQANPDEAIQSQTPVSSSSTEPVKDPKVKPAQRPKKIAPVSTKVAPVAPVAQEIAEPASEKDARTKKQKLVRDSFTIPKDEYVAIEELKQRAVGLSHPAKKSELIRAGIKLLTRLDDAALLLAMQTVPAIKTGRPKAEKK